MDAAQRRIPRGARSDLVRAGRGVTTAGSDDPSAPGERDFPVLVGMADRDAVPNSGSRKCDHAAPQSAL